MKKLICALLIVMFAVGSSWAWDNGYHVKQAPNKKGDMMIFPVYFTTADGWETKITVTNTSDRYSVVAKVIYRSHYWTDEMLDHLIYLSPRDVWIGYVKTIGGTVSLWSDDDSILASSNSFASPGNPVIQPFFTNNMCTKNDWNPDDPEGGADSPERGYIEVIENWYGNTDNYPAVLADNVPLDQSPPKVDKRVLLKYYPPDSTGTVEPAGLTDDEDDSNGIDHTINVLTGVLELQHSAMKSITAAIPATVFADFDVTKYMKVNEISGLDSYTGNNSLGEVEAALSKDDIAMHYVNDLENGNGTIHMFNFPTKQGYFWDTANSKCQYIPKGPFWQSKVDGTPATHPYNQCLTYASPMFDLSENDRSTSGLWSGGETPESEMCEEMQWLFAVGGNYFKEGWQEYRFHGIAALDANQFTDIPALDGEMPSAPVTTFDPMRIAGSYTGVGTGEDAWLYTGVPVIPVVFNLKNFGASNGSDAGISLYYGAYSDGEVYAALATGTTDVDAGAWLPDYQYWNYMDALGLNNDAGDNNNGTPYPEAATFPIDSFPAVTPIPQAP